MTTTTSYDDTCHLENMPDEILEMIFEKLPLWKLKDISKVNKRSRAIVAHMKPKVKLICDSDVEFLEQMINGKHNSSKRSSGIKRKTTIQRMKFFNSLLELISNFPNVIKICGGRTFAHLAGEHMAKIPDDDFWDALANMIPNIESMFALDPLNELDISASIIIQAYMGQDFIPRVMKSFPDANPCSKQWVRINSRAVKVMKKFPHLTCKLCVPGDLRECLSIPRFQDRLVAFDIDNMRKFMRLRDPFYNVDIFCIDTFGGLVTGDLPNQLSDILPNLKKLIFDYSGSKSLVVQDVLNLSKNHETVSNLQILNCQQIDKTIFQLINSHFELHSNLNYLSLFSGSFSHSIHIRRKIVPELNKSSESIDKKFIKLETDKLEILLEVSQFRPIQDVLYKLFHENFSNLSDHDIKVKAEYILRNLLDDIET